MAPLDQVRDLGPGHCVAFNGRRVVNVVDPDLAQDVVSLNSDSASATFNNANVGNGKTVTAAGYALAGADAGDYTFTQPTTTANITTAALSVTAGTTANVSGACPVML